MWELITAALAMTAASAADARFEGVIESRITIIGDEVDGAGTTRLYVARQGLRIDTQTSAAHGSVKATTLFLRSKPEVTYFVDDDQKTYAEVKRLDDQAPPGGAEKFSVNKLPRERVAGYDCDHALLVDESGDGTEIWVSKAIPGADAFWAAQAGVRGRDGHRMTRTVEALRASGLDGWPLKWQTHPARRGLDAFAWEAVRVERKSLPASLFSLSGYIRTDRAPGAMGATQLTPQQQRKLQEAVQKMPPERRKQLEEMMNTLPGGERAKED